MQYFFSMLSIGTIYHSLYSVSFFHEDYINIFLTFNDKEKKYGHFIFISKKLKEISA